MGYDRFSILILILVFSFCFALFSIYIFENMKLKVKISKLILNDSNLDKKKNKIYLVISKMNFDKNDLEKKLTSAGFNHPLILSLYYPLKCFILFLSFFVLFCLFMIDMVSMEKFFLSSSISIIIIFFIPDKIIESRIKSNIKTHKFSTSIFTRFNECMCSYRHDDRVKPRILS